MRSTRFSGARREFPSSPRIPCGIFPRRCGRTRGRSAVTLRTWPHCLRRHGCAAWYQGCSSCCHDDDPGTRYLSVLSVGLRVRRGPPQRIDAAPAPNPCQRRGCAPGLSSAPVAREPAPAVLLSRRRFARRCRPALGGRLSRRVRLRCRMRRHHLRGGALLPARARRPTMRKWRSPSRMRSTARAWARSCSNGWRWWHASTASASSPPRCWARTGR